MKGQERETLRERFRNYRTLMGIPLQRSGDQEVASVSVRLLKFNSGRLVRRYSPRNLTCYSTLYYEKI
jgi:hypothetical protein